MTEVKTNAVPLGATLVEETELWMSAQGDVLAGVEAMITGWVGRQRQAYEASSRSVQKMCEARNLFDLLQAQHELLSDCLNWTACEIRAAGSEIPRLTRMATERFGEHDNGLWRGNPVAQAAPSISVQRAAAE